MPETVSSKDCSIRSLIVTLDLRQENRFAEA
jgi:hypothetical protein